MSIQFEDVTSSSLPEIQVTGSYAIAWGDFNGDGYLDIWANHHNQALPSLYINQKNGAFEDRSDLIQYNEDGFSAFADQHGAMWLDFDNDGDQDLLQLVGLNTTRISSQNQLFINDNGVLTNRASDYEVTYPEARSRDPIVFDYNNDGVLDFIHGAVANGTKDPELPPALFYQQDGTFFTDGDISNLDFDYGGLKIEHAILADFTGDGQLEVIVRQTWSSLGIYETSPEGNFVDISSTILSGVSLESSALLYDMAAADFNGDAIPDLFFPANNNNHQLLLSSPTGWQDESISSGVRSVPFTSAEGGGVVVGDFDNDMDLDMFILVVDPDSPDLIFENQGDGTFVVNPFAGSNGSPDYRSAAAADYDNDGFLDILETTSGNDPTYRLFHNSGNTNNWILIDLEGTVSNRDGIGASVYVTAGGVTQLRQQDGGQHHRAQDDSRIHVGLGEHELISEIRILWPSGVEQVLTNVSVNQILQITEPFDGDTNNPPEGSIAITGTPTEGETLTADASGLSDADGLGSFSYQWQAEVEGVWTDIDGATSDTFTPDATQVGSALRVIVSYTDGGGTNESVISAVTDPIEAIDPGNTAPEGTIAITGTATEGETLTADASGLSDADGLGSFSYQWQAQVEGVWTDIDGATSDTFTPDATQVGSALRVIVSYTDGGGTNESVISAVTDPISTATPSGGIEIVGTGASELLEGTSGNDTISAGGGKDTLEGLGGDDYLDGGWGGDSVNGGAGDDTLVGAQGTNILTGGTGNDAFLLHPSSNTDTITDFTPGEDWLDSSDLLSSPEVLDTNGDGVVDSTFLTVQGDDLVLGLSSFGGGDVVLQGQAGLLNSFDLNYFAPPSTETPGNTVPEGTITITGTPTEGETLTADASGLSDADGLGSFSYQWQAEVEGVWTDIDGATSDTFTPDATQVGSALRVIVSYTDGGGTNESVISAVTDPIEAIDPGNTVPEGTIAITGTPTEGETLTADASGLSDADGLGSFSYQWQAEVEGVWTDIDGATSDTFTPDATQVGSALRVIVSYTDGGGTNESVISAVTDPIEAIDPGNTVPEGTITITGTPTEGETLTADASGLSDADGLGSFSYQWQAEVEGVWTDIDGATSDTFTPDATQVGSALRVIVSYTDGGGTNESVISAVTDPISTATPSGGIEVEGTRASELLEGTSGNDTISAGGGKDTLEGLGGDDYLDGGWGGDSVNGGAGDDTLVGAQGTNILTGGTGNDAFLLHPSSNTDTITDFTPGEDWLDSSDLLSSPTLLDGNGDGLVDSTFLTVQGDDLVLGLSSFGGGDVVLQGQAGLFGSLELGYFTEPSVVDTTTT
jgi:Ca2+-binding RTX toxin-like protein